ncbi:MAG TPA: CDP-alcohol phosphatidyltransferase family protein [Sporichthyaceae bacterium]|nr:CDP-alcohol phosphatidyltransferase family protein [Sporichthyaceae bacterium]
MSPAARPSLAELRAVAQPPAVLSRANAEHWAGLAYGRKISIHVTRALVNTRITPDGITWGMILAGGLSAVSLSFPGVWTAVLAALLIQVQLILDCSDGELARWRQKTGASGVYLDRIGHYVTEAGLTAALGIRAGGGWGSLNGWATVGFATATVTLLVKAETDLVHTARALAKLPPTADGEQTIRAAGLRGARAVFGWVPIHRALLALEFSFVAMLAAVGDSIFGTHNCTKGLCAAMLPIAIFVAGGHLLAILLSNRLRPPAPEPMVRP